MNTHRVVRRSGGAVVEAKEAPSKYAAKVLKRRWEDRFEDDDIEIVKL